MRLQGKKRLELKCSKRSRLRLKNLKISQKSIRLLLANNVGHVWLHHTGYAYFKRDGRTTILHRFLMECLGYELRGLEIDHVNCDKLDNRLFNLRVATRAQNRQNRHRQKTNTSGYKGVSYFKKIKKWGARLGKPPQYLGVFKTKNEAAIAYNRAARKLFGKFAKLNLIK